METKIDLISVIDLLGLVTNLASLILSIVAIWLALYFKKESDRVNASTMSLLVDIKTDAKTVSQVAMPELQAYGQLSRQVIGQVSNMHVDSLSTSQTSGSVVLEGGKSTESTAGV